ncbi:hypothetical protein MUK42_01459, partial [Musa troglodytarum]
MHPELQAWNGDRLGSIIRKKYGLPPKNRSHRLEAMCGQKNFIFPSRKTLDWQSAFSAPAIPAQESVAPKNKSKCSASRQFSGHSEMIEPS